VTNAVDEQRESNTTQKSEADPKTEASEQKPVSPGIAVVVDGGRSGRSHRPGERKHHADSKAEIEPESNACG
jgi:hypothetical protein